MKQKSEENINDFLNRLEKEAFRQDLGQNIIVQIALNGIDKAVGCAISTHGSQTLDDVRRLASRQQTKSTPTVNNVETDLTSALVSKLELMTAALTDFRVEVNMMKTSPRVTHPPAVNTALLVVDRSPDNRPGDQLINQLHLTQDVEVGPVILLDLVEQWETFVINATNQTTSVQLVDQY